MTAHVEHDAVNHPRHYTSHPSGVECIEITEHMNFTLGNAVKYLFRRDGKGQRSADLRKAAWYLRRELERRQRRGTPDVQALVGAVVEHEPERIAHALRMAFYASTNPADCLWLAKALELVEAEATAAARDADGR